MNEKLTKKLSGVLAMLLSLDVIREIGKTAETVVNIAFERTLKACGINSTIRKKVLGEEAYLSVQEILGNEDKQITTINIQPTIEPATPPSEPTTETQVFLPIVTNDSETPVTPVQS